METVPDAASLDGGVHLVVARPDRLDDLALERLVLEHRETLVDGVLVADERLVLGHDLAHRRFDPDQVVVAEMGTAGQLEVVVEAVLDDRSDGVVGARPQPKDGLGQHVGCRVAQDGTAGIAVGGDHPDLGPIGNGGGKVHLDPVEVAATAALARRGTDGLGELIGRRPLVEFLGRTIGKSNGDG